ncbi:TPA: hypothetical protein ACF54C_000027 [Serratia marcescens]
MAKNEFLTFGTAANANVLSNADYQALPSRTSGFGSGVAKSEQLNKVWRQSSVMTSAMAQYIADSTGNDVLDNGDMAALNDGLSSALSGRLIGVKVFTSSQTYTPTLGTKKIVVEMVGGGGAGGSVVAGTASSNQVAAGSGAGGEGGAYGMAMMDVNFNAAAVSVGKAGTASTTAPIDGGVTTISINGNVVLSVSGGATGTTMTGPYNYPATLGGRRVTGDTFVGNFLYKIEGKPGGLGTIFSTESAAGGDGGASHLSTGSPQGLLNDTVGKSTYKPTGYGCGGTGACAITRSQVGGDATAGIVIIKEYA